MLPTRVEPEVEPKDSELFALAGLDRQKETILLKIVNRAASPRPVMIRLNGSGTLAKAAQVITISHDDPSAENTLDEPDLILPREAVCDIPGSEFLQTVPANSLTVLRLGIRQK